MNTTSSQFIVWYFNEFVSDPLYVAMTECSEDSKWHREGTVAIHTNMVVAEYISMVEHQSWTQADLLGAIACAFHDVGKPVARTEKHSEARGTYYSYGGHEIISARLWEDWACRNWESFQERFNLTIEDLYMITWMIEHHRPWGLKDKTKRLNLFTTATLTVGFEVYQRMLRADNWGRIGDTQDENRIQVLKWVDDFRYTEIPSLDDWSDDQLPVKGGADNAKRLFVMIGCSGSGKSTFSTAVAGEKGKVFSWDALRLEWYDPDDYGRAFELASADSGFMNKAQQAFTDMLDGTSDVFVDNVNTSAKRRKQFITLARQRGYRVVGVIFPTTIDTVSHRQVIRPDKNVPYKAVLSQFMNTQMPQLGEFDEIVVTDGNI